MHSDKPLSLKVYEWLQKQGYPLEMEVASALSEKGLWVRRASHYTDPESDKSREIDVISTETDVLGMAELHFVVECKASEKPWILFSSKDTLANYNRLFALGILSDQARHALSKHIDGARNLFAWFNKKRRVGYSMTQAFTNSDDPVHSAVFGAVKACLWLRKETSCPLFFAFPVVVVDAPLVECFLDDDGEMHVEEIPDGVLFFDGQLPNAHGCCLRIISRGSLRNYCDELMGLKDAVLTLIQGDIKHAWETFLEKQNYPNSTKKLDT